MKIKFLLPVVIAALLGMANSAFAQETKFDKNHPRRAEVNGRLANQNARIDRKEAKGNMSRHEAGRLHREDHSIRKEERRMASRDGGHISKADQRRLNRRENHVSRQIHRH